MNNQPISDEMFLGAYDADGSFLIVIDSYLRRAGGQPFGIGIRYDFAQSNTKRDLVEQMTAKFGGKARTGKTDTVFRVGVRSEVGAKMRQFFLKNPPLSPAKLYDFLLTEEILLLLNNKAQFTKQGQVTLITLAFQNSRNKVTSTRKKPLSFWREQIKATPQEYVAGVAEAKQALDRMNKKVELLEIALPSMVLSPNYIRGAHVGDGGLTFSLSWKPNPASSLDRRRCEPEWTISGENPFYCEAFVKTLGGDVNSSGPNCRKFRLTGIDRLQQIFYLFEDTWLPEYKAKQFSKFKEAIRILQAQEHLTEKGTVALVELVYDMSEKGTRLHSLEEYIQWGLAWVRRRTS